MKKKAPYKNSLRSREQLKNALIALLKKGKSFEEISISDLVKEAGVNRGTFYNHYASFDALVNEIEDELTEEISTDWEHCRPEKENLEIFVRLMAKKLQENESLYKKLIHYIPNYVFNDMKSKLLEEFKKQQKDDPIFLKASPEASIILANGIIGAYMDYLQGFLSCSFDELTDDVILLLRKVAA